MTDTKEGPVDSPGSAEFNRHKIKSANNKFFIDKKSYIPAEEIRDLLSQEHSMQSIEQLQDNWDRIPKAFQVDVVNYLLDAQKEYGKNSLYGKKIENFLVSILPSGHEVIKQIKAAIHPKNNAKKGNKEQKNLFKTRFSYDGWHYCEFSDNGKLGFLKYKDGQSETVSSVEIPDPDDENSKITILPAPQIAQTKRDRALQEDRNEAVKFPPGPIDYESEYALYCEIKAFIHTFIELKQEDEIILALYVMKASIFDVIKDTSFPFIHVLAPYGKGKSRLLTVMCEVTPYAFYSVDIKSAALKRISDLYGSPLFVDEKSQMDNDLAAILNGKYNSNALVLNANNDIQTGYSAIIGYRIFGPLVLAGRTPFRDDAIESKSFQVNMDFELTRDDVPRKIKGELLDSFTKKAREIRGKLLQFRVKWHDKVNEIKETGFLKLYEKHTEPRLFEVISFFEDLLEIIPQLKHEIGGVLKSQILRNVEVAAETPNGIIALTFLSLMEEGQVVQYSWNGKNMQGIRLSEIYSELGENYAKQSGKILSALGLRTDRPRLLVTVKNKKGEEEQTKKIVSVVRIPEEKKIQELRMRYDHEYVIANLSGMEQGQQATLIDEIDEIDDMGSPPTKNNNENNNPTTEIKGQQSKEHEKTDTPSQNDRSHRSDRSALNGEPSNSAIQNENSLWESNPKKALFELVETEAPKAEYHTLKPKAIHELISMRGISLSTVYDLCEQLHKEGAIRKTNDGGYYVNIWFLNGGDYP